MKKNAQYRVVDEGEIYDGLYRSKNLIIQDEIRKKLRTPISLEPDAIFTFIQWVNHEKINPLSLTRVVIRVLLMKNIKTNQYMLINKDGIEEAIDTKDPNLRRNVWAM